MLPLSLQHTYDVVLGGGHDWVVAAKRLMPPAPYGQVAPALRVLCGHHPDLGKAELPVLGVL
jgi:hypothetical protein